MTKEKLLQNLEELNLIIDDLNITSEKRETVFFSHLWIFRDGINFEYVLIENAATEFIFSRPEIIYDDASQRRKFQTMEDLNESLVSQASHFISDYRAGILMKDVEARNAEGKRRTDDGIKANDLGEYTYLITNISHSPGPLYINHKANPDEAKKEWEREKENKAKRESSAYSLSFSYQESENARILRYIFEEESNEIITKLNYVLKTLISLQNTFIATKVSRS